MEDIDKIARLLFKNDEDEDLAIQLIQATNVDVEEVVRKAVEDTFKFPEDFKLTFPLGMWGKDYQIHIETGDKWLFNRKCTVFASISKLGFVFDFKCSENATSINDKLQEMIPTIKEKFKERLEEEIQNKTYRINRIINYSHK